MAKLTKKQVEAHIKSLDTWGAVTEFNRFTLWPEEALELCNAWLELEELKLKHPSIFDSEEADEDEQPEGSDEDDQ